MHGTLRVTEKKINDNKPFWKTIEPFLSDNSTQKIILIEKKRYIIGDDDTAKVLNILFSNIGSNLKIDR